MKMAKKRNKVKMNVIRRENPNAPKSFLSSLPLSSFIFNNLLLSLFFYLACYRTHKVHLCFGILNKYAIQKTEHKTHHSQNDNNYYIDER